MAGEGTGLGTGADGEHILDGFVKPLVEAARDQEEAAPGRWTLASYLLFFLVLMVPVIATAGLGSLKGTGPAAPLGPSAVVEPPTVSSTPRPVTDAPVASTTTTQIEVVQPETEVIEGPPVPAPEPAPGTAAPHTDAPAPPHGG